jgi:Ca2+-binding EF-hand superfamily protein
VSTGQTMPLSMDEISLDGDVMSHIYKVFQRFDHDQDGRINAKELQRTLATVGMQLTHEMAGEVLREMDEICQGLLTNGHDVTGGDHFADDGELNFEEFFTVLQKLEEDFTNTERSTKATLKSIAKCVRGLLERVELKKKWRTIDRSRKKLQDVRASATAAAALPDFKRLQLAELLKEVPLLATLREDVQAMDQLLDVVTCRKFKKGQDVVRHGDMGDEFFVVLKGKLEVLSKDGTQLAMIKRGGFSHPLMPVSYRSSGFPELTRMARMKNSRWTFWRAGAHYF